MANRGPAAQPVEEQWTARWAKRYATGISSKVLTLTCAGWVVAQRTDESMSSGVRDRVLA